jgi:hypothetical protein
MEHIERKTMKKIKVNIDGIDFELTENQIYKKLDKIDSVHTTNLFLMDHEDNISLRLKEKIQDLLDSQNNYYQAMKFENKIYYDQLDRTSNDPEVK